VMARCPTTRNEISNIDVKPVLNSLGDDALAESKESHGRRPWTHSQGSDITVRNSPKSICTQRVAQCMSFIRCRAKPRTVTSGSLSPNLWVVTAGPIPWPTSHKRKAFAGSDCAQAIGAPNPHRRETWGVEKSNTDGSPTRFSKRRAFGQSERRLRRFGLLRPKGRAEFGACAYANCLTNCGRQLEILSIFLHF
jgi:hypothetical protein